MQNIAQALLVLKLSGSGTALGFLAALQFLPVLLLTPLAGVVTDRLNKRSILYCTQSCSGVLALALGLLVLTDAVRLWMVFALAGLLGLVTSLDTPVRMTFVFELVGPAGLSNAVGLNNAVTNCARLVGPSVASAIVVTSGLAACFLINAASFGAVLLCLVLLRSDEMQPLPSAPRASGQLREGLRYVRDQRHLRALLLLGLLVGALAWNFQVSLPLLTRFTFHGGDAAYGVMTACQAAGAVVGGLVVASFKRPTGTSVAVMSIVFGTTVLLAAAAPNLLLANVAMVLVGGCGIAMMGLGNSTLQLSVPPQLRGRMNSLWVVALMGTTPVGGPVIGWLGDHVGPRYGFGIGGVAAIGGGLLAAPALAGRRPIDARNEPVLGPSVLASADGEQR